MDEIKISKPIDQIKSRKWFWVGLLIALFNPIFSGLILGSFYLTEPALKKYGWIILTVAIIWGVLSLLAFQKFGVGQFVR